MALGATPKSVIAVIVRGAITPLLLGLVLSLIAAIIVSRYLTSVLYDVSATDPITYALAITLLLAIGVAGSIRPAWRAAHGDPLKALRTE